MVLKWVYCTEGGGVGSMKGIGDGPRGTYVHQCPLNVVVSRRRAILGEVKRAILGEVKMRIVTHFQFSHLIMVIKWVFETKVVM